MELTRSRQTPGKNGCVPTTVPERMLVPELDVTELAASLLFYADVLEFRILFERPDERFAYLERGGAVHAQAVEASADIVVAIEERWYRVDVEESGGRWRKKGPIEVGNRQFVLADPDGYLWRPFRDLGERSAVQ